MDDSVQSLLDVIGGLGEMARHFYWAMIQAGATVDEARSGMDSFIWAFWRDAMNDARGENHGEDDANDGEE